MEDNTKNSNTELESHLSFLKRTKDGEFAEIDESSFENSRLEIVTNFIDLEEESVFYSIT